MQKQQYHSAFVMYWIAFNACYEEFLINELKLRIDRDSEKTQDHRYLDKIVDQDLETIVEFCAGIEDQLLRLIGNHFAFDPFWKLGHLPHYEGNDWKSQFDAQRRRFCTALKHKKNKANMKPVLHTAFDRVYCVRNQIIHGSATRGDSNGMSQTSSGSLIMHTLIPAFVRIMENSPYEAYTWSFPSYPGEALHPQPDGRYVQESGRPWRY